MEYPHQGEPFPTPEGWDLGAAAPPPYYLGLSSADETLYESHAILASRLSGKGSVEGLAPAPAPAGGGGGGGAPSKANIATERADIEIFRRSLAPVAGAAGVRAVDLLAPADEALAEANAALRNLSAFVSGRIGVAPLPPGVRELELAQARMLGDLVAEVAPAGPFAGHPRRRAAAPLILAAFREGERARAAEYARYIERSALLRAPVCPVPTLLLRT